MTYIPKYSAPDMRDLEQMLEDSKAEVRRVHKLIDQYLPTVIVGLQEVVYDQATMHKLRDELTPQEVGLRAALSAAHHIVKGVMDHPQQADPIYDLPSVLDLLKTRKTSDSKAAVAALMDAAQDVVFTGISGMHNASSLAERERIVQKWLEDRATRISREAGN